MQSIRQASRMPFLTVRFVGARSGHRVQAGRLLRLRAKWTSGGADPAPRDAFEPVNLFSIGRRLQAIPAWTREVRGMVAFGRWQLPGVWLFTRSTPWLSSRASPLCSICSSPLFSICSDPTGRLPERGRPCRVRVGPCRQFTWGESGGELPAIQPAIHHGNLPLPGLTLPSTGPAGKRHTGSLG